MRNWKIEVSEQESIELRKGSNKTIRQPIGELTPGSEVCLRVRVANAVGWSEWAATGPFAKIPPDVPSVPNALLSELTALEFIELKWMPPCNNGAPILRYEIRMTVDESIPTDLWSVVDPEELARGTIEHGSDGRKSFNRDKGMLVFRKRGLKDGTTYFFTHRAWNVVGHSEWSEVSRFTTKSSKPCRVVEFWSTSIKERELQVGWNAPESSGVPLTHYDIVGGPNLRVVRWCQFACMILDATVDSDKLFGYKPKDDCQLAVANGNEHFAELYCEDAMYAPVEEPTRDFTLSGLLPGQDYYFIARAVAHTGKGEFSEVLGPIRTLPEKPLSVLPVEVCDASEKNCSLTLRLPFNMGLPINQIQVVLRRAQGPLAHFDLHPESGEIQEQLTQQIINVHPKELESAYNPEPLMANGLKQLGVTEAVRRAFEAEAFDKCLADSIARRINFDLCTNKVYKVNFQGLLPGSEYQVEWSCGNELGWTLKSSPVTLNTHSSIPDQPLDIMVSGL